MKFSRILALACAATLSGCAYIIPPDNNAPRNNTVVGAPHRPQLNNNVGPASAPSSSLNALPQPVAMNQPALPPVDAATQAQAEQEMAMNPAPAAPGANERHVPVENAQFQVAGNYPALNSVPPRPAMGGPNSTRERLDDVQTNLIEERSNAITTKENLAKDAAAEPSMLSDLPKTDAVVPANDPVKITPIPAEKPAASAPEPKPVAKAAPQVSTEPVVEMKPVKVAAPRVITPAPQPTVTASSSEFLPPSPTFAPPAPRNGVVIKPVAAAKAEPLMPVATQAAMPAPVTVREVPVPAAVAYTPAPAPAAAPVAIATNKGPTIRKGDFDPLAAADNAPLAAPATAVASGAKAAYVSSSYLAPSRYADRRY